MFLATDPVIGPVIVGSQVGVGQGKLRVKFNGLLQQLDLLVIAGYALGSMEGSGEVFQGLQGRSGRFLQWFRLQVNLLK